MCQMFRGGMRDKVRLKVKVLEMKTVMHDMKNIQDEINRLT